MVEFTELETSIFAFCDSIKDNVIKDDQMEDAIEWLNSYSSYILTVAEEKLEDLYVLLIDFIIFKNQNELIGLKIKELSRDIEMIKENGSEPYNTLCKEYKNILEKAFSLLDLKYNSSTNVSYNYKELHDQILESKDFKIDSISDYGELMKILREYADNEKYINM